MECFFAKRALVMFCVFPAGFQAVLAEVVSTWSSNWISEHFQTDRTLKVFSQKTAAGSHNCKRKGHSTF